MRNLPIWFILGVTTSVLIQQTYTFLRLLSNPSVSYIGYYLFSWFYGPYIQTPVEVVHLQGTWLGLLVAAICLVGLMRFKT